MSRYYTMGIILAMIVAGFMVIGCTSGSNIGSAAWPLGPSGASIGGSEKGGLRVWVFDRNGDPVGKAQVEVVEAEAGQITRVGITDDDGICVFSNIVVGSYRVRVSKGALDVERSWVNIFAEDVTPCEIQLGVDLGILEGLTVDQAGEALAGVAIVITSEIDPTTSITGTVTAMTGPDGSFRIDLASDTYWLSAAKVGYKTASQPVVIPTAGFHRLPGPIVLFVSEGVLRGVVVDNNNQPVNDASVEVKSISNPSLVVKFSPMLTGSQLTIPGAGDDIADTLIQLAPGAFQFNLPPGTYSIRATKDDLATTLETRNITAGIATELTMPLLTTPSVYGRVSGYNSGSGEFLGLENAKIEVGNGVATFSTLTTSGGDYSLPVPEGLYSVYVSKFGYMSQTIQNVNVGASGANINADIYPFPSIKGTVRAMEPLGLRPQENVNITVMATQSGILNLVGDGITNYNGEYSIEVPMTGPYRIEFAKQGFLPTIKNIDVASRGRTLNIMLGNLPLVRGTVQAPDPMTPGTLVPLDNVTVSAVNRETRERTESKSDHEGIFSLPLEEGAYDITYLLTGYVSVTLTDQNVGPEGLIIANQVLYPPAKLKGIIYTPANSGTDETLSPLAGVLIRVSDESGRDIASVDSGTEGAYTIPLPAGTYSLAISKEGYVATDVANVVVPVTGKNLNVTILLIPAIKGTIFDGSASGGSTGLKDVNIEVINAEGKIFRAVTNNEGKYYLPVDPPVDPNGDPHQMTFTKDLYHGVPRPGDAPVFVNIGAKGIVQDMTMYRLTLSGFVYASNGTGISGCLVLASGTAGSPTREFQTRTSSSGDYVIEIPSSTSFNVSFSMAGYKTLIGEQLVTGGDMAYDVTLYKFSSISGYVLASGTHNAVIGADVRVLDSVSNDYVTGALSDEKGYYHIDNLKNGTYGFSVQAMTYKTKEGAAAGQETVNNNGRIKDFILDPAGP